MINVILINELVLNDFLNREEEGVSSFPFRK